MANSLSRHFDVGDRVEIVAERNDFQGDSGYIIKPAHPDSPWDWVVGHHRGDWLVAVAEGDIVHAD